MEAVIFANGFSLPFSTQPSPSFVKAATALFLGAVVAGLLAACGGEATNLPARLPATVQATVQWDGASAQVGEQLANSYGCVACHSDNGSALVGPTWQGLYGTQEELEDGSSVLVDAAYVRESIREPDARITKGFTGGLMPSTLGVKDEEILHIIEYMKSLR